MMVEQFIDRLEQQGLLDKSVVDDLRRRVARVKGKKITPDAIAKYLVDGGHLTRFQATKLVNEITARLGAGLEAGGKSKSDELRLVPEDAPTSRRESLAVPKPSGGRTATGSDEEVDELTAIDRDLGPAVAPPAGGAASGPPRPPEVEKKPRVSWPTVPPPSSTPPPPPRQPAPDSPVPAASRNVDFLSELPPAADVLDSGDWGGGRRRLPAQRKLQKTSEWDSMLLLAGGASLGVMLVIGAFLYLSLVRGAAEELFAAGQAAYDKQSYTQAIRLYDDFLKAHPNHENSSLARVRREMARLRESYKNPDQGMKVALEVLPQIEQEEAFPQAREELASMLPQIAGGFVATARRSKDPAEQEQLLQKTAAAMVLVDNPEYIPSTLRKSQATTIESIIEDMARVRREIDRVQHLAATVETIQAAAASEDTTAAYAARQELLDKYPGLGTDEQLLEAMLKISDKERQRVQLVEEPLAPVADDPAAQLPPHAVLSHRTGQAIASVIGHVVYTLADGCVFAVDAATGDILWRRFVGFETTMQPQPVAGAVPQSDALVVDQRRQELLRLEAKSGGLVWRLVLAEPFYAPLVVDQRLFVAASSGKLFVIDAATGQVDRHVKIPQPLEVAAAPGVGRPQLYQVAEQDNLYVLSTDTLECREVLYLGHKRGTVTVPPVMALGYLFVVENAGPDFSYLHIIATDEQGLNLKVAQQKIRLRGQVLVSPVVGQRRVMVVTDRRAVEFYEVDPNNASGTPVMPSVQLNATAEAPTISYPLVEGGYAWVANNRFTKYQVQPTTGKLPAEWVLDEQDAYVAPLQLVRDVVIHVRRRQNAPGVTIAATRTNDKDPSWQTEVGVPARGVFVGGETIEVVTARGRLFQATAADFERRVLGVAQATVVRDERLVLALEGAIDCGDGQWLFAPPQGYNQFVFYRPGSGLDALRLLTLTVPLGAAATPPVPFAGGLLVPLHDGTVVLIDPVSGAEQLGAFHPRTELGVTTNWNLPVVLDGGQEFVIADNRRRLFRVGIKQGSGKLLDALQEQTLEGEAVGPWAAVGQMCCGVIRSKEEDTVVAVALPALGVLQKLPLSGRLAWGPQRVGENVMLATEKELLCLDAAGQEVWRMAWDHGPVIGQALPVDAHVWLSAADGLLCRVDAATGAVAATVEVGEPLAAGPVRDDQQLLVAGHSGVLFRVSLTSP